MEGGAGMKLSLIIGAFNIAVGLLFLATNVIPFWTAVNLVAGIINLGMWAEERFGKK